MYQIKIRHVNFSKWHLYSVSFWIVLFLFLVCARVRMRFRKQKDILVIYIKNTQKKNERKEYGEKERNG